MIIDKHLNSFLDNFFKNKKRIRCLVIQINDFIKVIYWDEIGKYIKNPPSFIDDVYELIAQYDVNKECVVFIDKGPEECYLLRLQKL